MPTITISRHEFQSAFACIPRVSLPQTPRPTGEALKKSLRHCLMIAVWVQLFMAAGMSHSFAQGSKKIAESEQIMDRDRDYPKARNDWFKRGRTAPEGESAAILRHRALLQKLELRKPRLSARAVTPVPHLSSSGWLSLGPAPIASDATGTGSQDYGPVSGRATAVAIDTADITGNTVYIGGVYGGVWKSTNAATSRPSDVTWSPVLDYAENPRCGCNCDSAWKHRSRKESGPGRHR
jgi:hypothetical protein